MIRIDGSILEGGGQLLRNAASLSAITQTPIEVSNIRAGRKIPGLSPQHQAGLQLVSSICGKNSGLEGAAVRSTRIRLHPHQLATGTYCADTKTAGSCTLMMQQALPCLLFASPASCLEHLGHTASERRDPNVSVLSLKGGTDATMAPPITYLSDVLAPLLRNHLHLDIQLDLIRRGFYPKGGGIVEARVRCLESKKALPPITLCRRGELTSLHVMAYAAGSFQEPNPPGSSYARVMVSAAVKELCSWLGPDCSGIITKEAIQETRETAFGEGRGIIVTSTTSTGCILGAARPIEKGASPEETAAAAAASLASTIQSGACVDEYMQDQLIIFMALARGTSRLLSGPPTQHTQTAIVVAERLTGCQFNIYPANAPHENLCIIECVGVGHSRP